MPLREAAVVGDLVQTIERVRESAKFCGILSGVAGRVFSDGHDVGRQNRLLRVRKQNLQTRIKAVLERAGLVLKPLQQRSTRLCRVSRSARWLLQQGGAGFRRLPSFIDDAEIEQQHQAPPPTGTVTM